jgi:NAD(P)-dependent dehydrogenase (short-subunit alcohol dehydrogenase family)
MGRFDGKVVMIAGAARGIGLATAATFAREGAVLALSDVDPDIKTALDRLDGADGANLADTVDTAARIEGSVGRCDITDEDQCAAFARDTIDRFGRIDVLAVVAGVLQQAHRVTELPVEEWERVMAVNVRGPLLMATAVVPQMRKQGGGRIVNVASWWGYSGHAFFAAYCASKAAVRMLTQALAEEESGNGITANCVAPGNVDTDMHRTALRTEAETRGMSFEEMKKIEWDKIPLKHACPPEDIANGIAFLASDEARYITGATLDVNGGVMFR